MLPCAPHRQLPTARAIGQLLCETTEQLLWQPAAGWVRERSPTATLHCRTGSGLATYHRLDRLTGEHLITYGARMIEAKQSPATASRWLSAREIRERGYFGHELSTLNLLAHTCCHEFAHLLQQVAGQRTRGSVHNRHFYRILDQLHATGTAARVRLHLEDQAEQRGLPVDDTVITPCLPPLPKQNWAVGETVWFDTRSGSVVGEIQRVNRRTCTVAGIRQWRGARYRVSPELLRRDPSR